MDILIRQESADDHSAVSHLVSEAFKSAEHSDGNEQELVSLLRGCSEYIPELSLVAMVDDKIVGYILFTEITIDGHTHLALAPLAVLPGWQRKQIGSTLIREGHARAKKLGYGLSVVLGDYKYYAKFGYRQASIFGILPPEGIDDKYYMAIALNPIERIQHGRVKYSPPFGL